jgi:hypothetical protein
MSHFEARIWLCRAKSVSAKLEGVGTRLRDRRRRFRRIGCYSADRHQSPLGAQGRRATRSPVAATPLPAPNPTIRPGSPAAWPHAAQAHKVPRSRSTSAILGIPREEIHRLFGEDAKLPGAGALGCVNRNGANDCGKARGVRPATDMASSMTVRIDASGRRVYLAGAHVISVFACDARTSGLR